LNLFLPAEERSSDPGLEMRSRAFLPAASRPVKKCETLCPLCLCGSYLVAAFCRDVFSVVQMKDFNLNCYNQINATQRRPNHGVRR
jgi:hypothetical protein